MIHSLRYRLGAYLMRLGVAIMPRGVRRGVRLICAVGATWADENFDDFELLAREEIYR